MTHLEVVPFSERHLEEATALAAEGYRRERRAVPELTERPENAASLTVSALHLVLAHGFRLVVNNELPVAAFADLAVSDLHTSIRQSSRAGPAGIVAPELG